MKRTPVSLMHVVWLFAFCAVGTSAIGQTAAKPATAKTIRLLTIGNSFSQNATRHLAPLAKAGGHELIHRPIVVGGASLQLHAEKAQQFEREPSAKAGLYTNGQSLKQALQAQQWDFVTIQQASIKSHDPATYQPYAGWLHGYIKQHAPQAEVLVHKTWAYRRDDPRFSKKNTKPGEPLTQEAMYQGLSNAYRKIAAELGTRLIPVGDAFYKADTDPKWGFRSDTQFDLKQAQQPALPNQTHSLHVGWQWKKQKDGKTTLTMDGHHANLAGEYLGACTFYEVLFGESVVGNSYIPRGLDPAYAHFLQNTAHAAVAEARLRESGSNTQEKVAELQKLEGLVAFWDFQEPAGQPRISRGQLPYTLREMKGPVTRVENGVFGQFSARIKRGQWFMIPREELGALNIHGKNAQVTVVAWIRREDKADWQAIAGVWDETRKKRQYCLFLNAPRGTRSDEMKRYPLANRIHGHVSAVGGPTPGEQFCITYSSGATEIPLQTWHCLAMSYDGKESRVYVNGKLDALEHYNPFPYPEGLFDGGADGADFTVGAVHRGGEWGNFFGGQIGGLAVFQRALTEAELRQLSSMH